MKKGKITKGMTKRVKEVVKKSGGFPFIIPKLCEWVVCYKARVCFHYCKKHHEEICK